jgi:hypothetical protein
LQKKDALYTTLATAQAKIKSLLTNASCSHWIKEDIDRCTSSFHVYCCGNSNCNARYAISPIRTTMPTRQYLYCVLRDLACDDLHKMANSKKAEPENNNSNNENNNSTDISGVQVQLPEMVIKRCPRLPNKKDIINVVDYNSSSKNGKNGGYVFCFVKKVVYNNFEWTTCPDYSLHSQYANAVQFLQEKLNGNNDLTHQWQKDEKQSEPCFHVYKCTNLSCHMRYAIAELKCIGVPDSKRLYTILSDESESKYHKTNILLKPQQEQEQEANKNKGKGKYSSKKQPKTAPKAKLLNRVPIAFLSHIDYWHKGGNVMDFTACMSDYFDNTGNELVSPDLSQLTEEETWEPYKNAFDQFMSNLKYKKERKEKLHY